MATKKTAETVTELRRERGQKALVKKGIRKAQRDQKKKGAVMSKRKAIEAVKTKVKGKSSESDGQLVKPPSVWELNRVSSKRRFLEAMCQYGTITDACKAAGISHTIYYNWTTTKYNGGKYFDEEFVREVALAKEAFRDVLRNTARLRAVEGIEKPVFGSLGTGEGTGIVGHVREYSDRLLELLMRFNLPEAGDSNGGKSININNVMNANVDGGALGFDPTKWPQTVRDKWRELLEAMADTASPSKEIKGEVIKSVITD